MNKKLYDNIEWLLGHNAAETLEGARDQVKLATVLSIVESKTKVREKRITTPACSLLFWEGNVVQVSARGRKK